MYGVGTFKLRKPLRDNPLHLYFNSYQISHCEYSFNKEITKFGEIRSDVLSGNIRVTLPLFPDDDILSWVFDSYKKLNGEITMHDSYKESLGKIYFEEGRCVKFHMHYESAEDSTSPIMLLLIINAQRIIIGESEYINRR